jgi:hypothetical protein
VTSAGLLGVVHTRLRETRRRSTDEGIVDKHIRKDRDPGCTCD